MIPSRAGLPTALIGSLTAWQTMSNYHQLSDVPDNLHYDTIASATRLAYAVAAAISEDSDGR